MQRVVVLVQADSAIGWFGRGDHRAEEGTRADVDCFFDECYDLSVHVVGEAVLDDEDRQGPAQQVRSSDDSQFLDEVNLLAVGTFQTWEDSSNKNKEYRHP